MNNFGKDGMNRQSDVEVGSVMTVTPEAVENTLSPETAAVQVTQQEMTAPAMQPETKSEMTLTQKVERQLEAIPEASSEQHVTENEDEIKKFTDATLKPTLSVLERRLNGNNYPFLKVKEAGMAAKGNPKQASTWAGLSVVRLYQREKNLGRLGLNSEYLRAA